MICKTTLPSYMIMRIAIFKKIYLYHLQDLITLGEADNAVVEELFKDMESKYNDDKQEDFKSLFVQQQKKALMCSDSRARR